MSTHYEIVARVGVQVRHLYRFDILREPASKGQAPRNADDDGRRAAAQR